MWAAIPHRHKLDTSRLIGAHSFIHKHTLNVNLHQIQKWLPLLSAPRAWLTGCCNSGWSSHLVVIKMSVVSWHLLPFLFTSKRKAFSKKIWYACCKKVREICKDILKSHLFFLLSTQCHVDSSVPLNNVLYELVLLSFKVKLCFHHPHYFLLCPISNGWIVVLKRSLTLNKQMKRHEGRKSPLKQIWVELSARQISLSMPSRFMSLWL